MCVATRHLRVACVARRGRVAQEIGDVVLMCIRYPESCGEGVPQIVEVKIVDPGIFDRSFKTDHYLTYY